MPLKHLLLVAAIAGTAHADVNAASKAFSEGQAAQLAGDFDRAAENYELAYTIKPSKEALRSAVRARMQGQQLARAATLAEVLLASYDKDPASVKLAKEVLKKAKTALARVALKCSDTCTAAIDGRAAALTPGVTQTFYVVEGSHDLEVTFDGDLTVTRKVDAEAGGEIERKIEKPPPKPAPPPPPPPEQFTKQEAPPPPPPPPEHRFTFPKWVVYAGGGATVFFAAATTWSGLDTWKAHDAYAKNPTDAAYDAGRTKQGRTNALLATTAVFAIGTGVIAVFYTQWRAEAPIAVEANAHGAAASYTLRF
jgi:hypothetical protein